MSLFMRIQPRVKFLNWIKNNQLKVSGAINVGIGYFGTLMLTSQSLT